MKILPMYNHYINKLPYSYDILDVIKSFLIISIPENKLIDAYNNIHTNFTLITYINKYGYMNCLPKINNMTGIIINTFMANIDTSEYLDEFIVMMHNYMDYIKLLYKTNPTCNESECTVLNINNEIIRIENYIDALFLIIMSPELMKQNNNFNIKPYINIFNKITADGFVLNDSRYNGITIVINNYGTYPISLGFICMLKNKNKDLYNFINKIFDNTISINGCIPYRIKQNNFYGDIFCMILLNDNMIKQYGTLLLQLLINMPIKESKRLYTKKLKHIYLSEQYVLGMIKKKNTKIARILYRDFNREMKEFRYQGKNILELVNETRGCTKNMKKLFYDILL